MNVFVFTFEGRRYWLYIIDNESLVGCFFILERFEFLVEYQQIYAIAVFFFC